MSFFSNLYHIVYCINTIYTKKNNILTNGFDQNSLNSNKNDHFDEIISVKLKQFCKKKVKLMREHFIFPDSF